MPVFSGLALVITLSSMGLPGLNGFVGEFTILLGTAGSPVLGLVFAFFGTIGVILAAVYLLYMWNKVFMGEYKAPITAAHGDFALVPAAGGGHEGEGEDEIAAHGHDDDHAHGGANPYTPLTWNELTALIAVVIAAFVIGLYPRPFFGYMDASTAATAAELGRYIPSAAAQSIQAE